MEENIYISKRCKHCHELLILLHKNKNILKFNVVDVDSNPYPNSIDSVPCMIIEDKILGGIELFKFLQYLISENSTDTDTNTEQKNGEVNNDIPRSIETTLSEETKSGNLNNSSDGDLQGFCFGNDSCLIFSSFDDNSYTMANFEELQSNEQTKTCTLTEPTQDNKTNKAKELDDEYARLTQQRANDMRK